MNLESIWTRFKEGIYVRKEHIKVKDLPYPIGHISDLHFDKTGKLPQWVQSSILDWLHANPLEVLCVTGDIIDGTSNEIIRAFEWLHDLPVNYVVIALGNHDEPYVDDFINTWVISPYKAKLKLGINTSFKHKGINFISLADINSQYHTTNCFELSLAEDSLNVVLAHNPHSFWDIIKCKKYNIPLIMSGHTHGGQIMFADSLRSIFSRFMKRGKILNILRVSHEHDCFKLAGSYKLGKYIMHINAGLGSHPPGRFFCPPTITIYE